MSDSRKILVVDDTPTMRLIVTGMLQDLGYAGVEEAESAEMAWARIQKGGIDLVLADWNMPGRTGIELLRLIRGTEGTAGLTVMMMTSNNDPRQIREAEAGGISGYLVKPFGLHDLRERMSEAWRVHPVR